MKQEKEMMEVTPEEKDLIESIRNYNKSFPDGYPQLLWFAQELFDNMLRQPYDESKALPATGEVILKKHES